MNDNMPRVVVEDRTVPMPQVVADGVSDPMWPAGRTCGEVHPQMDVYHPDGH